MLTVKRRKLEYFGHIMRNNKCRIQSWWPWRAWKKNFMAG